MAVDEGAKEINLEGFGRECRVDDLFVCKTFDLTTHDYI